MATTNTKAVDESWKNDIRNYYRNSANQNVDDSDKQYMKALSQSDNAMLARGMQRSSYGAATNANLRKSMADAANKIRTNAENEANMAILNYQQQKDALDWQKEQAAQQQANWQAQFNFQKEQWQWQKDQAAAAAAAAASSGGGYGGYNGYDAGNGNDEPTWYDLISEDTGNSNGNGFWNRVKTGLSTVANAYNQGVAAQNASKQTASTGTAKKKTGNIRNITSLTK